MGDRAVGDGARAGQQQRAEAAHAPFRREVRRELAGGLAALDQRTQRVAEDPAAVLAGLVVHRLGRQLGERVALGDLQPRVAEPVQRVGGAALLEAAGAQGVLARLDRLELDRRDQRLARGEVAIDRRAADARGGGDVGHHRMGLLAEGARGHLHDAVDVAGCVRAQVLDGARHLRQQRSD
jgi:hypothetical protein